MKPDDPQPARPSVSSIPAAPATSAAGDVTAQTHVEHYFPKGYDPNAEPWKSIRQHVAELREQLEQLQAWRDYAEGLGLRIGICKSSDCPEGRLAHDLAEGSELHRIFDEWSHSIGRAEQLATAQKETSEAQAAVRLKDDALEKLKSEVNYGLHLGRVLELVEAALAVQPDSSALSTVIESATAKLNKCDCGRDLSPGKCPVCDNDE